MGRKACVSPPSLRTPLLGAWGMRSQAQCGGVVSGVPPDPPACLPSSTAAAEQMLCPGERKKICYSKWENAGRVKVHRPQTGSEISWATIMESQMHYLYIWRLYL